MRSREGIEKLAHAVRKHAAASAAYNAPSRFYKALVISKKPFTVEIVGTSIRLDADTLLVTNSVRLYDKDHGIRVGDTVLVFHDGEDWIVTDVVAAEDADFAGVGTTVLAASDPIYSGDDVTVTPSHHIVGKIIVTDASGTTVGVVPVFGSLPA